MNKENYIGQYSLTPYAVNITIDHTITTFNQALPEDLERQTESLQRLVLSKPKSALTIIEYFLNKYPENPAVACFASSCYEKLGRTQKAIDVVQRLYQRHPHSILLRSVLARWFINQGLREYVHQMLGENLYINEIAPEQKTFYALEMTNWALAVGLYFVRENNQTEVQKCIDFINEIAPTSPYAVRLMTHLNHMQQPTGAHEHAHTCNHTHTNHTHTHNHIAPNNAESAPENPMSSDTIIPHNAHGTTHETPSA
jgi:tetratricopeptide (TPR) repeat protein